MRVGARVHVAGYYLNGKKGRGEYEGKGNGWKGRRIKHGLIKGRTREETKMEIYRSMWKIRRDLKVVGEKVRGK